MHVFPLVSVDQLECLENAVLLERMRATIKTSEGEVTADRIIPVGKAGLVGVAGYRSAEEDEAFEPKDDQALYFVHKIGANAAEQTGVGVGDVVVMNTLIRNVSKTQVGGKEYHFLWWDEGMILAKVNPPDEDIEI